MLDALGKPGSGLFQGNLFWPGSFSECEGMKKFQYCLAGFSLKMYTFSKKIVDVSECNHIAHVSFHTEVEFFELFQGHKVWKVR